VDKLQGFQPQTMEDTSPTAFEPELSVAKVDLATQLELVEAGVEGDLPLARKQRLLS
jgi:hypothetical protein